MMRLSRRSSCLLSWFSCFLNIFCNITFVERFSPFCFSRQMSKFIHFTSICHMILTKFLIFTIIHKLIQNQVSVLSNFHSVIWRDFVLFNYVTLWQVFVVCIFSLSDFLDFFSFHNNKLTIFWIWWNNVQ